MIDASFVKEIVENAKNEPVLVDTGYNTKIVVFPNGTYKEYANPKEYEPKPLTLSTLQGVADYVKAGIAKTKIVVQVVSPTEVRVVSPVFGDTRATLVYVQSSPVLPALQLNQYQAVETFLIQLQSGFLFTIERVELQKLCGSLKAGKAAEFADDGISQSVNVQSGVTRTSKVDAKLQWDLSPFRTFPEITQPESAFILRMKQVPTNEKDGYAIHAGLFEADGGAWRVSAISQIGAWLDANINTDEDAENKVTILS